MPAITRDIGHLCLSCCNHSRLSTVDTGADTAATVIMGGRILTLDRNSSAVFRNETLVLSQGKAWLADQNGSGSGIVTRLTAAPASAPLTAPLVAANMQKDGGGSKDQDICAQFPKACDQAEDACEKKFHRECVCHYHSDHDKDDVSPIHPDADDFKYHPVGNKCKNAGCRDERNGNGNGKNGNGDGDGDDHGHH